MILVISTNVYAFEKSGEFYAHHCIKYEGHPIRGKRVKDGAVWIFSRCDEVSPCMPIMHTAQLDLTPPKRRNVRVSLPWLL